MIAAAVIIAFLGYNPLSVYGQMIKGSLGTVYRLRETITKAVPLTVIGLGALVCFRMRFINIGAEGQFYIGAITATGMVFLFGNMPGVILITVMFLSAFIGGGLWCAIAAVLKLKLKVNEALVTLMLNYIAIKITSYLQYGPWKDPNAYGFPKIATFPEAARLQQVFGVHIGWLIALVLTILIYIMLNRTKLGYEIAIIGDSATTAAYAGISTTSVLLLTVLIGGGLCGVAGMLQASGVEKTLNDQLAGGMGYTGIIAAFLAKLNPAALVFVAIFFAVVLQGGAYIQSALQIPSATTEIVQGIILLFVLASEFFSEYHIIIKGKKTNDE